MGGCWPAATVGTITNKDFKCMLDHRHSLLILQLRRALAPTTKLGLGEIVTENNIYSFIWVGVG